MAKLCPLPSSMVVEALRVRMPGMLTDPVAERHADRADGGELADLGRDLEVDALADDGRREGRG